MPAARPTAIVLVLLVALAGCTGSGLPGAGGDPTTGGGQTTPAPTTAPPGTAPPGSTTPPTTEPPGDGDGAGTLANETVVFDSGSLPAPIIEGGIQYPEDAHDQPTYDAALLTTAADTARFNWSVVPTDAAAFVNATDFDAASLLVIQTFPASSVPDYRVERVTRDGDRLDVRINDSSWGGTADITLETVVVRIEHDGTPPTNATVVTEEGVSFETAGGPVTVDPDARESPDGGSS